MYAYNTYNYERKHNLSGQLARIDSYGIDHTELWNPIGKSVSSSVSEATSQKANERENQADIIQKGVPAWRNKIKL